MTRLTIRRTDRARAALAALACLGSSALGCTIGDDTGPADPGPGIGPTEGVLSPPIIHTGVDGEHSFLVPINTDLERFADGSVTWQVDDEGVATVVPAQAPPFPGSFGAKWALVEGRTAGATTVHAVVGDTRLSAEIIVTQYDPADHAAGDTRYNDPAGVGARASCASCHLVEGGADHTPTELGFHDDAAILQATVMGRYPDACRDRARRPCDCGDDGCELVPGHVLNDGNHSWELTAEEQAGIVPYLRSLAPNGFSSQ